LQNGEIQPSEAADRLGDLYSLFQGMGVGVAGWRSQVWQLLQEAEGLVGKSLASAPMSIHRSWITPVVSHYGIPYKVQNGKVYYDTSKVTKSAKDALHQSLRSAKSAISDQVQVKREYSPKKREEYAKRGLAMPDGSYPIRDVGDLKNAIQAFGRAKDPEAVKRHIIRRARSLGQVDLVPEKWML
jgi:hypothetical protein